MAAMQRQEKHKKFTVVLQKEKFRKLNFLPRGQFYQALVNLGKRHRLSDKHRIALFKKRMRAVGGPELSREWQGLVDEKRIFHKVLRGEPRASFAKKVPNSTEGIEKHLDEIGKRMAELLYSF